MAQSFASIAGRQLRTSTGKADSRRKLMMAVRAASRRLGLEDDDRKAIQLEVTGKASMADMTLAEIGQVLDRLNRDRPGGFGSGLNDRTHFANRPHVGKIRALWWTLYWLGEVAEPNDAALDAFITRQTGLLSIRFLDHTRAPSVIEALKSMAARAGVRWPTKAFFDLVNNLGNPGITVARLERHAVLEAIWKRLVDQRAVRGCTYITYVQGTIATSLNHWCWTERELDEAIRALGKKLRRAANKDVEGA